MLNRGQLVGVTTAGAVISTGSRPIMDIGVIRLPFRGWYVLDTGQDMELNGAVPHHVIWPEPGEWPSGVDKQLEKAIEVLTKDVEQWLSKPRPDLVKASEAASNPLRRESRQSRPRMRKQWKMALTAPCYFDRAT